MPELAVLSLQLAYKYCLLPTENCKLLNYPHPVGIEFYQHEYQDSKA